MRVIREEMDYHDQIMASLREELSEMATAERALIRLSGPTPANDPMIKKIEQDMTVPEMINRVFLEIPSSPLLGLTPHQVKEYIAKEWRSDIKSEQVGPIMWRMWKRGDLQKDNDIYFPVLKNTAVST